MPKIKNLPLKDDHEEEVPRPLQEKRAAEVVFGEQTIALELINKDQEVALSLMTKNQIEAAHLLREAQEKAAVLQAAQNREQVLSIRGGEEAAEKLKQEQEITAEALRQDEIRALQLLFKNQKMAAELLSKQQGSAAALLYQSQTIVENSRDAIIGTTLDGIITSWNGGAQNMFGYTPEEVIGKSGSILYPPQMWERIPSLLSRIKNREIVDDYDVRGLRKNGEEFDLAISISPVSTNDGVVVGGSVVERDITERKKNERELLQVQAVVNNSQDGIFGATLDGIITSWNGGARKMFGYSADEIVGKSATVLFPVEKIQDLSWFIDTIKNKKYIIGHDAFGARKDGTKVDTSISLSPVVAEDGSVASASIVVRDITERKESEKQILELNEVRGKFIDIISHQLRTPLTSINWNLEMVIRGDFGKLEDTVRDFLFVTHRASLDITNRIHDLLSAMDIQEGRMAFHKEAVSLNSIAATVLAEMGSFAEIRGVSCKYIAPEKDTPSVDADIEKIRTAIKKLTENAVMYTKSGGSVTAKVEVVKGAIRFEVSDTGVGIPEAEQHKVFSRFFRASNASLMEPDAFGLGLFITKSFVEQHKGTVGFKSKEGEGSTFWFEIPY